ncbi:MAG: GTP-binding protein [Candidatus Omnitrophota bacterium]
MGRSLLRVAMVGHVDHGKSTLIGRLLLDTRSLPDGKMKEIKSISRDLGKEAELAYLTDQFREERENNMTIDTTQVFLKTRKTQYVIIDSPGHVEFIKNMLTGATQADAAVLIVDVLEGLREQTRRHAFLMDMLGIKKLVVVFNKMDLVKYERVAFVERKAVLMKFFEDLHVKPLNIIPVSAKEGVNISKKSPQTRWYRGPTLLEALDALAPAVKPSRAHLRFPVQDVYEINGRKILAGQILSGQVAAGQKVTLLPSMQSAVIKSIEVFGKSTKKAVAGENIGLILKGSVSVLRGEVIAENNSVLTPTVRFAGNVFWISDLPLRINAPVTLRCATQEVRGRVTGIRNRMNSSTLEILEENACQLNANETGGVSFVTEKPAVVEGVGPLNGLGRFVIEQDLQMQGAGIIS